MKSATVNKNDIIELEITDIGSDGEGIGHYFTQNDNSPATDKRAGLTVFVKNAVPGDRIRALVMKVKKSMAFAKLVELLEPSKNRCESRCPVAGRCGGCQLQSLTYEAQLEYKSKKVFEDLVRLGGQDSECLKKVFRPIIGMESPVRYRNKAQFPVGTSREGEIVYGFYAGHSHFVIGIDDCMIQHGVAAEVMKAVKKYMELAGVTAYDEESGKGLVRHVLTRVGFVTYEVMVCLVINGKKLPRPELLTELVSAAVEEYSRNDSKKNSLAYELKSLTYNVNTEVTNVIMGTELHVIYGSDRISDYIGDVKYSISPLSFYQVNPLQTRKLYQTALDFADLSGNEVVWDLYCGIGTISLFLAQRAKQVYGVEIVPEAIADAIDNAKENNIHNAEFFVGAAEEVLPAKYRENPSMSADVIVVDPPRKGCDGALLDCIINLSPKKIVYVSCDPATLARDVKLLGEGGYELCLVQPVDMFPNTVHVETVCLLSKNPLQTIR